MLQLGTKPWAGSMCVTNDVIAIRVCMRAAMSDCLYMHVQTGFLHAALAFAISKFRLP